MYFRSNGLIDAGSRFTGGIPEKLELSAENFMIAFEAGVRGSFLTDKTDKEIQKIKEKEVKDRDKMSEINKSKMSDGNNSDLVEEIKDMTKLLDKPQQVKAMEILKLNKITSLKDPDKLSSIDLTKAIEAIKNLKTDDTSNQ